MSNSENKGEEEQLPKDDGFIWPADSDIPEALGLTAPQDSRKEEEKEKLTDYEDYDQPTPSKTADEVREEKKLIEIKIRSVLEKYIGLHDGEWTGFNVAAESINDDFIEPRDRELERLRNESTQPEQTEQKEAGSEQNPCSYCGKTLREQMKGCDEISCYRQFLPKQEQPQQPGSGEVESLKYYNERLKSDIQLMYVENKKLCDQLEPLQRENDLTERLLIAALARIELQEQQLSDKDKEIAELKGAENPLT